MEKINIRSPYYVTYSEAGVSSVRIDLWIYTGTRVQSTYPSTDPTYSLSSNAIDGSVSFEISELVRDYVDSNFNGTYTSSAVWVTYKLTKFTGVSIVVPQVYELQAYDGYGYFSDGANPQNRNALLVSSPTIYKMKDEVLTLPYNIGSNLSVSFQSGINTSTTSRITYNIDTNGGSFTADGFFTYIGDADLSSKPFLPVQDQYLYIDGVAEQCQVQEVSLSENRIYIKNPAPDLTLSNGGTYGFDVTNSNSNTTTFDSSDTTNESSDIIRYFSSTDTDRVLSTTDSATTIYDVVEIEECRNTPYKLTFVNKFGALEDIWFYGASRENTNTTKEDYKSNIVSAGSYSINEHQRKMLNKNGVDSMVINSNFYPEEHNETFKQLFLSEKVWITYKTQVLPIQITSNTISFKNRLNDKLINYEINIEFSNNTINNIR